MKLVLAGFNIDCAFMPPPETGGTTPESIAAAYARISRSPLSTEELRELARRDIEKARQSNEKIVFEMGHSSIAEHAVFNIDLIGISRLLVEEVEKFRLVSFTEKSQRYCLFQDDFTLPEELEDPSLKDLFVSTVRQQQNFYRHAYEAIKSNLSKLNAGKLTPALDNLAKEDARYAVPLATQTQLGMTINARNLELMIRRLLAHPLTEAKKLGENLFALVHSVAPSLIRYTKPAAYDRSCHFSPTGEIEFTPANKAVNLLWFTPGADEKLVAALLFRQSGRKYEECLLEAAQFSEEEKRATVKEALRHIQHYDQVRREFETVDLTYELTVSASCFAQLKRHRMATIITQAYHPVLGVTIPSNFKAAGIEEKFFALVNATNDAFQRLLLEVPVAAPYILTNAHRRRVLLKVNARELYHIARLRSDEHAQWDIRNVVDEMLLRAKEVMPLTLMLACGRDAFPRQYNSIFSEEDI